ISDVAGPFLLRPRVSPRRIFDQGVAGRQYPRVEDGLPPRGEALRCLRLRVRRTAVLLVPPFGSQSVEQLDGVARRIVFLETPVAVERDSLASCRGGVGAASGLRQTGRRAAHKRDAAQKENATIRMESGFDVSKGLRERVANDSLEQI